MLYMELVKLFKFLVDFNRFNSGIFQYIIKTNLLLRIVVPKYNLPYFPWIPFSGYFQTDSATLLQTVYLLSALKAALNHFQQKVQSLFSMKIYKFLSSSASLSQLTLFTLFFFHKVLKHTNLFPTLDSSFSKGKKMFGESQLQIPITQRSLSEIQLLIPSPLWLGISNTMSKMTWKYDTNHYQRD